jgi:transposase InsO family protein
VTIAGLSLEAKMNNELTDRQFAIQWRLAGEPVEAICHRLKRSEKWFHKWWQRYVVEGPEGLYDLSRAPQTVVDRIPPHVERTIVSIRRRLEAHATPETRYQRIGAPTVQAELKALQVTPLPGLRTIERVLHRHGLTSPRMRMAPPINPNGYPAPAADDSNQLHQVDLVGPVYLKGQRQRWYIYVCKDVFDGAVHLKLARSRRMDEVLTFLIEAWQHLGLPAQVQFDNAREFCGWGKAARYLSRVIRLCLYLRVTPIFIPQRRPQRNGAVENFNGWFQPLLFQRQFKYPAVLRRELARLMNTVNEQHVQSRLGQRTATQYRRGKRLRRLPARFSLNTDALPVSEGRVTFIRQVSRRGKIALLGQTFAVGRRYKFNYVKVILNTRRQHLTVYVTGKVLKHWSYKLNRQ